MTTQNWVEIDSGNGLLSGGIKTLSELLLAALGAGNYQQPQLPSANMADADLDTKLYSLSMQLLSTHSWC